MRTHPIVILTILQLTLADWFYHVLHSSCEILQSGLSNLHARTSLYRIDTPPITNISMKTTGRKLVIIRSFLSTQDTEQSGRTLYCCVATACNKNRRTKDFPSKKWVDIVLDGVFSDNTTEIAVAREHKTKRTSM